MELYSKDNCPKCDHIKESFDLNSLGVEIKNISQNDPSIWADLAWYELIGEVEEGNLPLLHLGEGKYLKHELPIKKYLRQLKK